MAALGRELREDSPRFGATSTLHTINSTTPPSSHEKETLFIGIETPSSHLQSLLHLSRPLYVPQNGPNSAKFQACSVCHRSSFTVRTCVVFSANLTRLDQFRKLGTCLFPTLGKS